LSAPPTAATFFGKTMRLLRPFLVLTPFFFGSILLAQTYVGNLNGTSPDSTFEGVSTTPLPAQGWSAITGGAQIFASTNTALIGATGYDPYTVQYATSTSLMPNSSYTLSFRMGYFAGSGAGNANYTFQLGTLNGSTFTPLHFTSDTAVPYMGAFSADGNNSVTASFNYTTGSSVGSDPIAVRWAQTNTSSGADFFGFDNVILTVSAIPEPSAYAVLFGTVTLAGAVVVRRRKSAV
jgi:hypothetical protein